MDKFTTLTGVAAPMDMINVDTDMIIPKQFLKTIQRSGLGKHAFSEMRYNGDGSPRKPDFVLNKPAYRQAEILVAGDNFGCGSSREHAPWALLDFGIRCVIATSRSRTFFTIIASKTGYWPIKLHAGADVDKLMDDAEPRLQMRRSDRRSGKRRQSQGRMAATISVRYRSASVSIVC